MAAPDHADCSAHRLNMFDLCPKALRLYSARRPDGKPLIRVARRTTEAMAKGKVMHQAIERCAWARRCKGNDLPATPTEAELAFAIDREAVRVRLLPDSHRDVREAAVANRDMIDLAGQVTDPESQAFVHVSDDVTAEVRFDFMADVDGVIVNRDWKCGSGDPLEHEAAWHDAQVGLYLVAMHALWPDAKGWEFHLVYVRRRHVVRVVWSAALDAFWRGRAVAAVHAWRSGYAPANVGTHCGECDFRFHCQTWLEAIERDDADERPVVELGDEALLEEREWAQLQAKLGSARRKDLDAEIRRRTRGQLKAGAMTGTIVETARDRVAVEALLELAVVRDEDPVIALNRAVTVSSRKAMALARNDTERALIARWTQKKKSRSVRVTRGKS